MADERLSVGLLLLLAGSGACKADSTPALAEPGASGDSGGGVLAGQTGDEGATPWTPGGPSNDSACPLSATAEALASLDEEVGLGFSANDLLAFAGGSHEARVRWNARAAVGDYLDYAVHVTPGGLDEPLQVTLSHDASPPRYRTRTQIDPFPDGGVPRYCRGQLELGVTVELRSQSSALDESWRGTLSASDGSEATIVLQAPTWRGRLPRQPDRDDAYFPNAQTGSLDVVDANDPGSVLAWVDVVLRFRTEAIDGSVNGWVQTADGGAFVLPQLADPSDSAGWIGVIGDGHYGYVWGVE